MSWTLTDAALYQLLRGFDPESVTTRLTQRFSVGQRDASAAVMKASQGMACAALCAGRLDEPIDLSGVPYNASVPDNTYRFWVGVGLPNRQDREVIVDVAYHSPGRARIRFTGGKESWRDIPGEVLEAITPQQVFALAWEAVAQDYPERKGKAKTFTFRAILRGLFRRRAGEE